MGIPPSIQPQEIILIAVSSQNPCCVRDGSSVPGVGQTGHQPQAPTVRGHKNTPHLSGKAGSKLGK